MSSFSNPQDEFGLLSQYARDLPQPQPRRGLLDRLSDTWPARLAKSAYSAATLPGEVLRNPSTAMDVLSGARNMSQETFSRATDLASIPMTGAMGAPAGALGSGPVRPGIRAYHGSPHDFDRFDMSKIGTGEGAQAYGRGLYFAGNEDVARSYRDALRGFAPVPQEITALPDGVRRAILEQAGTDAPAAIAARRAGYASREAREMDPSAIERMIESYRDAGRGRMYEVNINTTPDRLLDFDVPVGRQAPQIQEALRQVSPWQMTADEIADGGRSVAGYMGNMGSPEKAATALREAGIDGIRYLDQGSRGVGAGSRNYVVFDEKLIEILRKYGLIGGIATGAAAGASQAEAVQR